MAARQRDAERIEKDARCIDELLFKVDEFLSLQKSAMSAQQLLADSKWMTDKLLSRIASLEKFLKVGTNQVVPEQFKDQRHNYKTLQ